MSEKEFLYVVVEVTRNAVGVESIEIEHRSEKRIKLKHRSSALGFSRVIDPRTTCHPVYFDPRDAVQGYIIRQQGLIASREADIRFAKERMAEAESILANMK